MSVLCWWFLWLGWTYETMFWGKDIKHSSIYLPLSLDFLPMCCSKLCATVVGYHALGPDHLRPSSLIWLCGLSGADGQNFVMHPLLILLSGRRGEIGKWWFYGFVFLSIYFFLGFNIVLLRTKAHYDIRLVSIWFSFVFTVVWCASGEARLNHRVVPTCHLPTILSSVTWS